MASESGSSRWSPARLVPWLAAFVGMLVAWMAYYYIGHMFLGMPHEFHEGTMW